MVSFWRFNYENKIGGWILAGSSKKPPPAPLEDLGSLVQSRQMMEDGPEKWPRRAEDIGTGKKII